MTTTTPILRSPAGVSDYALATDVGQILAVPRHEPADSFVLHAPLELLARVALLPFVRPTARPLARRRLGMLGEQYAAWGRPVTAPDPDEFDSPQAAATRLRDAIAVGDVEGVDAPAQWLGRTVAPVDLRALLADDIVRSLAAAAHGPIFLHHLPRVAPRGEVTGELLRGLARELARYPDWRLHWVDETSRSDASPDALFAAVAATPRIGEPTNTFIFPLMSFVDERGIASARLAPVTGGTDVVARGRALLRAASWTMLLEPGDHAPYGWTHALSMPQAVLGVADALHDPGVALAIAATYVVGFRSALAREPLEPRIPEDPGVTVADALDASPALAAAAAWHR
ncbi:MAG TPA: hypothetical protein VFZ83_00490, partial [Acidimicrobiia bacterium]|nr:hypothetical protein [Acidimicrobiia bacterium]